MTKFTFFIPWIFAIFHLFSSPVFACAGYKLSVDYLRNCGKNDIVQLSHDFQPILHDDCTLTFDGCTAIQKSFNAAQINFDVFKNGARFRGYKNACDAIQDIGQDFHEAADIMGIPKQCPVRRGIICGEGKVMNIKRHPLKLALAAGTSVGKLELKTDSGDACIEFSLSLKKRFFNG